MRLRTILLVASLGFAAGTAMIAQRPFKEYPGIEYDHFPLPGDWQKKAEWTRARLRYPDIYGYPFQQLFMQNGREFPGYWTFDYPRSDRHLLDGVRRLTRIETRSVEQVVYLDGSPDVYNWPVMYAVEPGHMQLPDDQAKQLREYLLRGGFLMVDDFHGAREWQIFMASMNKVFPDRRVEDLESNNPIFHTIYDLDRRFQIPGAQYFDSHLTYEKGSDADYSAGKEPHWRGIYDDRRRLMVVICHNMDLGDAWEHSDEPEYKEEWAGLAYKIGMNYFIYDLTH